MRYEYVRIRPDSTGLPQDRGEDDSGPRRASPGSPSWLVRSASLAPTIACASPSVVSGRGKDHLAAFSTASRTSRWPPCVTSTRTCSTSDVGRSGGNPQTFVDVRKLLDDKSIDAISIATPNHWHTLMAIWACQAGKDVYVEKPCSHNLWEGRQLVRAAEKYHRIVQHGTQSRSAPAIEAIRTLHNGTFGEIYLARGLCFKWRDTIGHAPEEPVPAGVDYDLWTGPAPLKPFTRNRFHYNWHWIWDTGNGDLGNQGIHQVDVARWGLGRQVPESHLRGRRPLHVR